MIDMIKEIIWSPLLVYGLLICGIYFTLRMRLFQLRHFKEMIRLMFQGEESPIGVSSFQALAVSLAGRVGTGNIVGVATAIYVGGPGAIFWMWATAFLGAGSAFIESTLAQIYKKEDNGEYRGGPAYYIEQGIKGRVGKIYALIFALITIIATGFLLPSIQSNAISESVSNAFQISPWIIALITAIVVGLVIFGGIQAIANFASAVVPIMAIIYIIVAVIVVLMNASLVPDMLLLIIKSAFGQEATFGGILGAMIQIGVMRGIYSNEAGQGTGPHAAGAAEVSHPAKQGLVQSFSVYVDTLFVCTATALMILITGQYNVKDEDGSLLIDNGVYSLGANGEKVYEGSVTYTQAALDLTLSNQSQFDINFVGFGSYFIAIILTFFAFTTILAYYYIAETNLVYILKGKHLWLKYALKFLLISSVIFGAVKSAQLAWSIGDIGVGLMAWANMIAIVILHKKAIEALRDYERQKAAKGSGKYAIYQPDKKDLPNATFWTEHYPNRLKEAKIKQD
ncbi:alanine/glycine:cation symporter family protein [Abyssicoccus albus]|uniref:alanine/glycine:cation symporter family protein n=1 Tax=Abyssicoccus albus TaxID=1817405 RepID=UPI00097E3305|nr:alanine/glycine:cation symporter family protein [Abyssicoccus albus]AQL56560.1 sodium:alanine symporter [Abyssicoccus albus]